MPSVASSAPAVLIATVAAATSTIRVGAGGVMLPNHAPLKVAEQFGILEALHPGRIDLGIGRAPGTDQLTALALRRSREALVANDFPAAVRRAAAATSTASPGDHPFAPIVAQPTDVPLPPVWILGSSLYGAQAAAAYGTGFAFAGHFGDADPAEAIGIYREQFRPRARPATRPSRGPSSPCRPSPPRPRERADAARPRRRAVDGAAALGPPGPPALAGGGGRLPVDRGRAAHGLGVLAVRDRRRRRDGLRGHPAPRARGRRPTR